MRKKKLMSFVKNNVSGIIVGVIIGGVILGSIGVYAATYFPSDDVTYDNTDSGLASTDVQGAIDELYSTCNASSTSSDLKENVVTSGDGLYKDEYEDGRYFYKGANPNNYIVFSGEMWRILSLETDNTIKIVKDEPLLRSEWDDDGTINWNTATLNTYLNETYYNTLTTFAQNQIVSHAWSIGTVNWGNDLSSYVTEENSTKWNGRVALVTLSEYLRTNSNMTSCVGLNNYSSSCANTTWMYIANDNVVYSNVIWLLTARSNLSTNQAYIIRDSKTMLSNTRTDCYNFGTSRGCPIMVRPSVYLKSGLNLSGTGTQSDPYRIS